MGLTILDLPYFDAEADFSSFAAQNGAFFLDSSQYNPGTGRYSFWGLQPSQTLKTESGFVTKNGHTQIDSPQEALRKLYEEHVATTEREIYLPFTHGLVGFLGYEWGLALEELEAKPVSAPHVPDSWWGFYETIVGYDHLDRRAWVSSVGLEGTAERWLDTILHNRKIPLEEKMRRALGSGTSDFKTSMNRTGYKKAFGQIQEHLQAGNCYQINLTQQFSAPAQKSPWEIYCRLRHTSPAPYACYFNLGSFQILSSSPECFLQADATGMLTTRPIKGTRPRGKDAEEDLRLMEELKQSEKDRAELLMITDLERNDLGKVCEPGSVEVVQLQKLESYAQVHHMLSVIRGKRREDQNIIDCLAAIMPGGSITGAPKRRAMEIIESLEPVRRGIYTGALGWLGPQNTAHLNIAIRTMILQDSTAYFHAGGGVVVDSIEETEYEEMWTKAEGMMNSLQNA